MLRLSIYIARWITRNQEVAPDSHDHLLSTPLVGDLVLIQGQNSREFLFQSIHMVHLVRVSISPSGLQSPRNAVLVDRNKGLIRCSTPERFHVNSCFFDPLPLLKTLGWTTVTRSSFRGTSHGVQ